ncbi:hypothetical protein D9758_011677 [Tetrapyrgos nigripes]|uniref:Glycosyl hydrolase family 30 TIM-barrel domain-containing protein n=1 Tax=Tetrapyrgos nigripes TaxID=182062 RepID=A0A8H5GD51_9AGAR|nr:hypothetical protein D9758_011677 [Tetrapyrgos nigripes]
MRPYLSLPCVFLSVGLCTAQQIWDIWQTTWDRSSLFKQVSVSSPINFVSSGAIGSADIVVDDSVELQNIFGFGGTLTDSSALVLNNLKSKNRNAYNDLLNYLFSPTDGANAAGLSYIRIPLGASDFSSGTYNFDSVNGDTSFNNFNINNAPPYLFSVLTDIHNVNSQIKVHVLPWSPPGWMKNSGTMNGGSLNSNMLTPYATYLFKCLQGFRDHGITPYAISIQNEPRNSDTTYPTSTLTPAQEAQIGQALRSLMNNNGFGSVKIIAYDHNWDNAAYPVQVLQAAPNSFAGAAFHCYGGSVSQQDTFVNAFPNKEVYFTECAGTIGSDWWSDIKWYMDNIFIGALEHGSSTGLMWNIALDGNGNPRLPGAGSCDAGCRPIVTVNSDGSWSVNQEFYAMAHASKAIIPKDAGGPFGKRVRVNIGGSLSWALRVSAFVTRRNNPSDWLRYSLVVLNWDDQPNGSWNPTPVTTTIEFRGMQAKYTFPGASVTTLWWFAPGEASGLTNGTQLESSQIYADSGHENPVPIGSFKKEHD